MYEFCRARILCPVLKSWGWWMAQAPSSQVSMDVVLWPHNLLNIGAMPMVTQGGH